MKNFRIFRKNSLNGFTLIEMMVAMVIAALLAAIAIPYFWGSYSSMELRGSARTIASVLRTAKSYTEAQNVDYIVQFTIPSGNQLEMRIYKESIAPANQIGKTEKLSLGSAVQFSTTPSPYTETFTPQGACDGGTITIANTGRGKNINIDIEGETGRVKVSDIY